MNNDTIIAFSAKTVLYPHWQNVATVVAGALAGFLSCLGSGVILYSILSDWERKKKEVKYRFLLGLSLVDLLASPMYFALTLFMPIGSPNAWGAMGNMTTCNVQGVMLQMTLVGSFYNAALSHWFYCCICKGMSDKAYMEQGWEKRWHILSLLFPLATSIYLLLIGQYNYTPVGCWIGAYPYGTVSILTGWCRPRFKLYKPSTNNFFLTKIFSCLSLFCRIHHRCTIRLCPRRQSRLYPRRKVDIVCLAVHGNSNHSDAGGYFILHVPDLRACQDGYWNSSKGN